MLHSKILLASFLLLIVGCSSLPPSRIEGGRYINPKYEFSFEAPPSPPWFKSKELPDRFIPRSDSWKSTLGIFNEILFVDDAHNGAIAVEVDKTWRDIGAMPPQRVEALIRQAIKKNQGVRRAPFISDYNITITAPYVCDRPLPLTDETFTLKSQGLDYRCEIRTYIYTIHKNDACFLRFILWAAPNTYSKNKAVLDHLVKTLQRISPSTMQTAEGE